MFQQLRLLLRSFCSQKQLGTFSVAILQQLVPKQPLMTDEFDPLNSRFLPWKMILIIHKYPLLLQPTACKHLTANDIGFCQPLVFPLVSSVICLGKMRGIRLFSLSRFPTVTLSSYDLW